MWTSNVQDEDDDAFRAYMNRRMIRHWSTFDRNLLRFPSLAKIAGKRSSTPTIGVSRLRKPTMHRSFKQKSLVVNLVYLIFTIFATSFGTFQFHFCLISRWTMRRTPLSVLIDGKKIKHHLGCPQMKPPTRSSCWPCGRPKTTAALPPVIHTRRNNRSTCFSKRQMQNSEH